MTTGSLCFTEILMSRKPCSSNSDASHSADSTSASGVALPYFASSRASSDPAFTPIRIGVPVARAALAISFTLSSNCLMLPGFTRTAAQPASIAANTYFGWKWISAITGICDLRAMVASASASSCVGHATRTIWQPDAVSSAICWSVAPMSDVRVVVIDCTDTGASPPTATVPTWISPADPPVGELRRNGRHSERNRSHLLCNPKVWIKVPRSAGFSTRDYATTRGPSTSPPQVHPKVSGRT